MNKLLVIDDEPNILYSLAETLGGPDMSVILASTAREGVAAVRDHAPDVVLLDEPSSGLDLSARRQMWNMLKEHKKDKIIILTTHYMDEADILGD